MILTHAVQKCQRLPLHADGDHTKDIENVSNGCQSQDPRMFTKWLRTCIR